MKTDWITDGSRPEDGKMVVVIYKDGEGWFSPRWRNLRWSDSEIEFIKAYTYITPYEEKIGHCSVCGRALRRKDDQWVELDDDRLYCRKCWDVCHNCDLYARLKELEKGFAEMEKWCREQQDEWVNILPPDEQKDKTPGLGPYCSGCGKRLGSQAAWCETEPMAFYCKECWEKHNKQAEQYIKIHGFQSP